MNLRIKRSFFFETGKQFAHRSRIEQGSREAVLSSLARFFQNVDIFFRELSLRMLRIVSIDELRQAQSAGHSGGATANDHYVGRHFGVVNVGDGFAEDQHLALAFGSQLERTSHASSSWRRAERETHHDNGNNTRDHQNLVSRLEREMKLR
jgi:hypothetical protein